MYSNDLVGCNLGMCFKIRYIPCIIQLEVQHVGHVTPVPHLIFQRIYYYKYENKTMHALFSDRNNRYDYTYISYRNTDGGTEFMWATYMVQIMSGSQVPDYNNHLLLKGELKIFYLRRTTNCLQLYTYSCTVLQYAPAVITTIKTTAVPREFCTEEGSCSLPLLLGKFIIYNTQFGE